MSENDDVVEEMNKSFGIIEIGSKMAVMEFRTTGEIKKMWDFKEFKAKLLSSKIDVGSEDKPKIIPTAQFWLEHKNARRYWDIVYAMPGSGIKPEKKDYNGWLGFAVKAKQGKWDRNREHLLSIVCAGNKELFKYVMNWCAALIQQPGRHANTSLVLMGDHGVGKGHFADRMIGRLFYPQQYCHLTSSAQLTGRFNEHLSGKAFIFADEATWGGDPRAAGVLKALITEDTIQIERKFLPQVGEKSSLHIIIASNSDFPVRIEKTDRRFTILEVGEGRRQDLKYFGELHDELDNGGLEAFMYDLTKWEVDWEMTRRPMMTKGKEELALKALSPTESWWFEKLLDGITDIDAFEWSGCEADKLHNEFMEFTEAHFRHDRSHTGTKTQLGIFLAKLGVRKIRKRVGGVRVWFFMPPPLEKSRALFVKLVGWPSDYSWDSDTEDDDEKHCCRIRNCDILLVGVLPMRAVGQGIHRQVGPAAFFIYNNKYYHDFVATLWPYLATPRPHLDFLVTH